MKNLRKQITFCFLLISFTSGICQDNGVGAFMWDENTSVQVVEDAISRGMNSFRSRDITILQTQPLWDLFTSYGSSVDVMVAIPVYYTYTTNPVDLHAICNLINNNPFIRRLQIYPLLQPGLMNPSELNPCNDWLTGYADEFEQRIRLIDQLVIDKSVEIVISGQLDTQGCSDLTQIMNVLYDIQSNGRNVAWSSTVYPYFYNQGPDFSYLNASLEWVLNRLIYFTPAGKSPLPFRAIEVGWPSYATTDCPYSENATQANQCTFLTSVLSYKHQDIKLYYFGLQDNKDGWTSCEKYFGLYDVDGNIKCPFNIDRSTSGIVTVFKDCSYEGFSAGFSVGDYTLHDMNQKGILNNSLSSIRMMEGYKVILFEYDNFLGESIEITSDMQCNDFWNDRASSMKVLANGDNVFYGTSYIENRVSELVMDIWESSIDNSTPVYQQVQTSAFNQQFQFYHLGNGVYNIINILSHKFLDVDVDDGVLQQWEADDARYQRFILVPTGDGFYKIIVLETGKVLEVQSSSIEEGASIIQMTNVDQQNSHWKLHPADLVGLSSEIKNTVDIYPNPVTDYIHIKSLDYDFISIIYDIHGNRLSISNESILNVGELLPGIYVLEIAFGRDIQRMRFVKK